MPIDMDMLVDDVMRRHPATVRTFLAHKMACVGCPIGGFHTIADACREHGVDAVAFLAALHAVIDGTAALQPIIDCGGSAATGIRAVT